jgi:hypothetical protein
VSVVRVRACVRVTWNLFLSLKDSGYSFGTLSIARYSIENNVSETEIVSIFRSEARSSVGSDGER